MTFQECSNIDLTLKFTVDTADPNYRCCHSKLISDIFEHQPENIVLKTIAQSDLPGKVSTAIYFLICMLLLTNKRNILLLENRRDAHFQNHVLTLKSFRKLFLRATRIQDFRIFSLEESFSKTASYKNGVLDMFCGRHFLHFTVLL